MYILHRVCICLRKMTDHDYSAVCDFSDVDENESEAAFRNVQNKNKSFLLFRADKRTVGCIDDNLEKRIQEYYTCSDHADRCSITCIIGDRYLWILYLSKNVDNNERIYMKPFSVLKSLNSKSGLPFRLYFMKTGTFTSAVSRLCADTSKKNQFLHHLFSIPTSAFNIIQNKIKSSFFLSLQNKLKNIIQTNEWGINIYKNECENLRRENIALKERILVNDSSSSSSSIDSGTDYPEGRKRKKIRRNGQEILSNSDLTKEVREGTMLYKDLVLMFPDITPHDLSDIRRCIVEEQGFTANEKENFFVDTLTFQKYTVEGIPEEGSIPTKIKIERIPLKDDGTPDENNIKKKRHYYITSKGAGYGKSTALSYLLGKYKAGKVSDCTNFMTVARNVDLLLFDEYDSVERQHLEFSALKVLTGGDCSLFEGRIKSHGAGYIPNKDATVIIFSNKSPYDVYARKHPGCPHRFMTVDEASQFDARFHVYALDFDINEERSKWVRECLIDHTPKDIINSARETLSGLMRSCIKRFKPSKTSSEHYIKRYEQIMTDPLCDNIKKKWLIPINELDTVTAHAMKILAISHDYACEIHRAKGKVFFDTEQDNYDGLVTHESIRTIIHDNPITKHRCVPGMLMSWMVFTRITHVTSWSIVRDTLGKEGFLEINNAAKREKISKDTAANLLAEEIKLRRISYGNKIRSFLQLHSEIFKEAHNTNNLDDLLHGLKHVDNVLLKEPGWASISTSNFEWIVERALHRCIQTIVISCRDNILQNRDGDDLIIPKKYIQIGKMEFIRDFFTNISTTVALRGLPQHNNSTSSCNDIHRVRLEKRLLETHKGFQQWTDNPAFGNIPKESIGTTNARHYMRFIHDTFLEDIIEGNNYCMDDGEVLKDNFSDKEDRTVDANILQLIDRLRSCPHDISSIPDDYFSSDNVVEQHWSEEDCENCDVMI